MATDNRIALMTSNNPFTPGLTVSSWRKHTYKVLTVVSSVWDDTNNVYQVTVTTKDGITDTLPSNELEYLSK